MAMKENTRQIWDYIVAHAEEDMTAQSIADALGMNVKSIRLTEEGAAFDPDAEPVKE